MQSTNGVNEYPDPLNCDPTVDIVAGSYVFLINLYKQVVKEFKW